MTRGPREVDEQIDRFFIGFIIGVVACGVVIAIIGIFKSVCGG